MAASEHTEVRGPLAGPAVLAGTTFHLRDVGYVQEEYILAGVSTRFDPQDELAADGRWRVRVGERARFSTRLVVHRPADPARFCGVVALEWLNVSAGFDMAPDWIYMHRELTRTGAAWVGVSAQKVGIDGGRSAFPGPPRNLKSADPERYGELLHPGDAYAFDIFTQAAHAVREGHLELGAAARTVIATGHSQSAAYLVTYVNALDGEEQAFDGYLIHGRPGAFARLDGADMLSGSWRGEARIREDVRVPVLTLQAETDVIGGLMSVASRQPDGERFRLWEVAGGAHGDNYVAAAGLADSGLGGIDEFARAMAPTREPLGIALEGYANCAPQMHYVQNAAFSRLVLWVEQDHPPPSAPWLEVASVDPPSFRLDAQGNALGGVRTPWVDIPTSVYSGLPQNDSPLAALFGQTLPFPKTRLAQLYPGGLSEYEGRFRDALQSAVERGFILEADAEENVLLARALFGVA